PWTVFQHGTHHELGAIDFSPDLLGPSRVGSPSSAKRRTCESRFQGGQDRIGNGQLELTAASPSLQPISRNRDRSMRAAESIRIGPTYVTIRREVSCCEGLERNLQCCGEPGDKRLGDTSLDARQGPRLNDGLVRAVAAESDIDVGVNEIVVHANEHMGIPGRGMQKAGEPLLTRGAEKLRSSPALEPEIGYLRPRGGSRLKLVG